MYLRIHGCMPQRYPDTTAVPVYLSAGNEQNASQMGLPNFTDVKIPTDMIQHWKGTVRIISIRVHSIY